MSYILKGCPKCHGDLLVTKEETNCLLCGWIKPPKVIFDIPRDVHGKKQRIGAGGHDLT